MATVCTFGRHPTLGEMKAYYAREDVISFLYDECQIRNVHAAFQAKRWPSHPTSKNHLRTIIGETIQNRIIPVYQKAPKPIDDLRPKKHEYLSFHSVVVDDDGVLFDFSGSEPQRRAPVNSTYAQTFSACAYVLKCLIDPDVPVNSGFYRLVRVLAPEGTVVNCTPPTPVVGGWETQTRLTDVILKALALAIPKPGWH